MSITLNDNIKINAGKPSESKYLSTTNLAYTSVNAANSALPTSVRHVGLTVLIVSGGTNTEYWYQNGVTDGDLIQKKYAGIVPVTDFISGATNIGVFSGYTGIQSLPIDNLVDNNWDGIYNSLYNYYYRGTDQKIHIGTPTDGIPRRGYLRTIGLPKSWIWNEANNYNAGWIFVDGDVSNLVGTIPPVASYYNGITTFPYNVNSWTTGSFYNNGSNAVVNTVVGSLTTGSTYVSGGAVYSSEENQILKFKGIQTKTPEIIKIISDESLVYISGKTSSAAGNSVGVGTPVYKNTTINGINTTLNFRTIAGISGTTVSQSGDTIVISSVGGGGGGGLYNLSSPATVTVGGITAGMSLLGNTAFELFEKLLVPTQYPVLTNPSSSMVLSPTGTFEVGCSINLCVTSYFDAGCINPQYTATCDKRSNGVNLYCLTGAQVGPGSYACTSSSFCFPVGTYSVVCGTQTWGACQHYLCGVQPKDSSNNNYCSPLVAGSTISTSANICGLYPYYYGTASNCSPINQVLITGGTKCVADSNGTITVDFNSNPNQYTWLAIPSTSTPKTCWYVNGINNGSMNRGCSSDKYPGVCVLSISSGQGCWSSVSYSVYMSGTVGENLEPIEFRN